MNSLALEIKNLRIKLGLLQEELAEKIGVTKEYISALETNKKSPSYKFLYKLYNIANYDKIPEYIIDLLNIEKTKNSTKSVNTKPIFNLFETEENYYDDLEKIHNWIDTKSSLDFDFQKLLDNISTNNAILNNILEGLKYLYVDDFETYHFFISKSLKIENTNTLIKNILYYELIISMIKISKIKDKNFLDSIDPFYKEIDQTNGNFFYKTAIMEIKEAEIILNDLSYDDYIKFVLKELKDKYEKCKKEKTNLPKSYFKCIKKLIDIYKKNQDFEKSILLEIQYPF